MTPRTVVAGFGSELRGDDAVGLAVVRELAASSLPEGVRCVEVGDAGLMLVHELLDGCDRLIVIDAVRHDARPGSVHVLHPIVPEPAALTPAERSHLRVDAHLSEPSRAMLVARALGALPDDVTVLGIEVLETEEGSLTLSPEVARAVPAAVERARMLVAEAAVS